MLLGRKVDDVARLVMRHLVDQHAAWRERVVFARPLVGVEVPGKAFLN